MKKSNLLIILLLACSICSGQSLVPNGGFEQYSACPSYWGQIDSSLYWINPDNGTPDYFNACSAFNNTGVPGNGMGSRPAHSGVAYGGIALYDASGINKREYIETPLTSQLIAGVSYHFEMYASIGFYSKYTTDAIQVYFSDTLIANINSTVVLPFSPQISNASGAFISISTAPWNLISGDYIAHGGESYVVIGNFKNDSSTALQISGSVFNAAYSYIDDVSLTFVTGTDDQTETRNINLFPNPFTDKLNITLKENEQSEITLYDIFSRKLFQKKFSNSTSINTRQLAKGIYIYEVRNKNGVIRKGKVVKG